MRAHVRRYLDAGVDTAFLQLQSFESDLTRKRQALLEGLHALAPTS